MASLKSDYPWIKTPLIVNAPMGGFAGGLLASAVTQAGGIGFLGVDGSTTYLARELQIAQDTLSPSKSTLNGTSHTSDADPTLPIGVGLLLFILDLPSTLLILSKYRPQIIWLFAAKHLSDYTEITQLLRSSLPYTPKIWIQTGSVSSALALARDAKPDVLVLQGTDAGGHGLERGASIISLVPETLDTLSSVGYTDIPVLAAGGIVDSRGVLAATALGASGAVLGTRFLSARETLLPHEAYRTAILKASDGGQSTTRHKVFDELRGPNIWPAEYDGRSLRNASYEDYARGEGVEVVRERFKSAVEDDGGEKGFGEGNLRAAVWVGTGVGLVKRVTGAEEIVGEVRAGVEVLKGRL